MTYFCKNFLLKARDQVLFMCLCVFYSKDLYNSGKQVMVERMVRKYGQMHRNYEDR